MKFSVLVGRGPRTYQLDLGGDPVRIQSGSLNSDQDPNQEFFCCPAWLIKSLCQRHFWFFAVV